MDDGEEMPAFAFSQEIMNIALALPDDGFRRCAFTSDDFFAPPYFNCVNNNSNHE